MTYNILNGAPDRIAAVCEVIGQERPDVLALQELRGYREARSFDALQERLGMRGFLAGSRFGQPVAVLVREGLTVGAARPVRGWFHHAAVRVDVDGVLVVGTHLCPFSAGRRLIEARQLARLIRPGRPMLLLGDLNSLDPWTEHVDRVATLPAKYRRRHLRRGRVDTRAVAALDGAGLVDLFRLTGPHTVGHSVPTGLGGVEFAAMRLDYAMATEPLAVRCTGVRIVTGAPAATASDHYPVVATFAPARND